MKNNMISQFIKSLTKDDIYSFANKNNIYLNNEQLDLVYNKIKNNYQSILSGDVNNIFFELKQKFDLNSYNKIEKLYYEFKNKYLQ